ncbi:DUF2851 family protein [Ravibacter arvi]|uniref:DUF2851 family protein n=1 Tax=Ravibacter arvi TaxID=2051041 RepID=A0ABP8LYS7_9BACT
MNEDFLAYLWQHQYFDRIALQTVSGSSLTPLRPGHRNSDAGPDFLEARIEIDGILWAGTVEIHVRTSDWNLHKHHNDRSYGSVILHVVWENDLAPDHYPNNHVPVLSLKDRVSPDMLALYTTMLQNLQDIPCESQFEGVSMLQKYNMIDKTLIARLQRKSVAISEMLTRNKGDWDETAWQLIARYFGARINADAFQKLAERVPLRLMLRHRADLLQLEALLFGTAHLIPGESTAGYVADLKRQYLFLSGKYGLRDRLDPIEWKLLRLRPAGFPTVRIAQLAALIHRNGNLFSLLTSFGSFGEIARALKSVQSPYWHTHYHFGKPAKGLVPPMGAEAVYLILINAAAPILAAYGFKTDTPQYLDKAIGLLEETPAENNKITRKWRKLGIRLNTSAASQGATEWYQQYCSARRCLYCSVGNALLSRNPAKNC